LNYRGLFSANSFEVRTITWQLDWSACPRRYKWTRNYTMGWDSVDSTKQVSCFRAANITSNISRRRSDIAVQSCVDWGSITLLLAE